MISQAVERHVGPILCVGEGFAAVIYIGLL